MSIKGISLTADNISVVKIKFYIKSYWYEWALLNASTLLEIATLLGISSHTYKNILGMLSHTYKNNTVLDIGHTIRNMKK